MTIHASEQPLHKVLSNEYCFHIPAYQRPYSWQVQHAAQLFDDVSSFFKDAPNPSVPYFLGSIVVIKADYRPDAEVVDGQQRLTTLSLLLAAIRHRQPGLAGSLTSYLLQPGNPLLQLPDRNRLTPRERDEEFYRKQILEEGAFVHAGDTPPMTDSQRAMWQNAREFQTRLATMSDDAVRLFAQGLITRCFLVVVATSDFTSAYRVFSVLNDRGLDLAPTDILKADVIGQLQESEKVAFTREWEDAEEELGRDGFLALFAHIRMIKRKQKASESLIDELRKHVLPESPGRRFIDDWLKPYASHLQVLRDATYASTSDAEKINRTLRYFGEIGNADWLPPAMFFLQRNPNNAQRLLRFLEDLERLAASLAVRRIYTNPRLERYGEVMREIEAGVDVFQPTSRLQLSPEEQAATLVALSGNLYEDRAACRMVLLRLDAALSDVGASYTSSLVTIEHVLPQSPDDWWTERFPDEVERASFTNSLGNLVLLSRRKNAKASNFDFLRKKNTYFRGDNVTVFALTTGVLAEDDWTPTVVRKRQSELLERLRIEWRL